MKKPSWNFSLFLDGMNERVNGWPKGDSSLGY